MGQGYVLMGSMDGLDRGIIVSFRMGIKMFFFIDFGDSDRQ